MISIFVPLDNFKSEVEKINLNKEVEIINTPCCCYLTIAESEKLTNDKLEGPIREKVQQIIGILRLFKRGPIGFQQIMNLRLNHYIVYYFKKYWPNPCYEIKKEEVAELKNLFSKYYRNIKYGKNAFYFFQKAYREPTMVDKTLAFWTALESLYKEYTEEQDKKTPIHIFSQQENKWISITRPDFPIVLGRLYKTLKNNSNITVDVEKYNNVMKWAYDMRCRFVHGDKVPTWEDGWYDYLIQMEKHIRHALQYYLLNERDYFRNGTHEIKIEKTQGETYEIK